ncbi:Cystathionine beta-lyase [Defluviimonas aquaemixtae]|uniref:Cystathionine beta-lyase n=1 Tax=Albidovulum aquaemixtae TaxID=1542388 RepID=A0A2R8B626_9RHOB|nr:cystathionine gamma-lyase [Defluviimonas aquaemixtae]SPH18075.1 Cystathionine beta-lyase [Defluviimonas aquaemixtae]
MTSDDADRAAALLHLRGATLDKGEPLPMPLTMASMYHLPGDPEGAAQYGRTHNATWEGLEKALGHLEGAPCIAFPSGMAAIAGVFFATLRAGDRLLLPSDGYYATRALAERFLAPMGIVVETRPTAAFLDGGFEGYRLVFVETPSNPGLDVCDIAATAEAVRAASGLTVVDNTTMTPFGQRPLDFGADIVVSADTKAMNGHSDLLMGHVATRDADLLAALSDWRRLSGSIPGPFEAWLAHRGLETLDVRFARMCDTAEAVAPRLADHPALLSVRYPGLTADASHGLAARQMRRFGFLIGLTFASKGAAERFIDGCAFLRPATSFGGVHSSAERRARWGDAVEPSYVRLSIGCEPAEALWPALERELGRATS